MATRRLSWQGIQTVLGNSSNGLPPKAWPTGVTIPQRAAVIDIGSNAVNLLVADCWPDQIQTVHTERGQTELGAVVAADRVLGAEKTKESADLVAAFAAQASHYGTRHLMVLATYAVRAALDRPEFTEAVQEAAGTTLSVLSPVQEAALCLAGASLGPLPPPPFLFADIGGGSCEIASVDEGGITEVASIPVGSGVLAATRLSDDPPDPSSLETVHGEVRDLLNPIQLGRWQTFQQIVVTGGAARRLGRQAGLPGPWTPSLADPLLSLIETLLNKPSEVWPSAISAKRAAVVRAGAVVLRELIPRWHVSAWRISPYGLREGALVSWIRGIPVERPEAERMGQETETIPAAVAVSAGASVGVLESEVPSGEVAEERPEASEPSGALAEVVSEVVDALEADSRAADDLNGEGGTVTLDEPSTDYAGERDGIDPEASPVALAEVAPAAVAEPHLLPRELSLIRFYERVLDQARPGAHPLLERIKFVAISDASLDEFLSIHFPLLLDTIEATDATRSADGETQPERLARVRAALRQFMEAQRQVYQEQLLPELEAAGIVLRRYRDLEPALQASLRQWFLAEVFPVSTPLGVDRAHPFPFISNLSINLGVVLQDSRGGSSFARIKVPTVLPRLIPVPGVSDSRSALFVWLEDIMANNLDVFFPGIEVKESFVFRVIRDAELELQGFESASLREMVQAGIRRKRFGEAICIQLETPFPDGVAEDLIERLDIYPEDVYVVGAPLGLTDLTRLLELDRPDLKDSPLVPRVPAFLGASKDLFALIRQGDLLLYHPYESIAPVLDLIAQAAVDPNVLTIKQTLYRIGRTSPLIDSLLKAVDRGKQVAVVLELQARGDEENNVEWAQTLERAGAHVSYGVIGLKTHAKISLVVRREPDGLRRYVHVGTGNYSITPYADLSLFTSRPEIGEDATEMFNALTGHSRQETYRQLLVSPWSLRQGLLERITRETRAHRETGGGHLIFKANGLTDPEIIEALYEASRAGVRIDIIIRGMCCLRPGVRGISETIRVVSLVGRFLEHARVYYFRNGGQPEVLLGSADLMERNLDGRVEALAPVREPRLVAVIKEQILDLQLSDTHRASELYSDGSYRPVLPNGRAVDAQMTWITGSPVFSRRDVQT